jgi:hypothetical protein
MTINNEFNNKLVNKRVEQILAHAVESLNDSNTVNNREHVQSGAASDGSADDFFGYDAGISEATSSNDTTEMEEIKYFADGSNSLHSLRQYPGVLRVFMKFHTPLPSSAQV